MQTTLQAHLQAQADRPPSATSGTAAGLASEALLHQLCDVLAAIVEGEEPFGPLVIQRAPAAAATTRRDSERRPKEGSSDDPSAKGNALAAEPAGWPQGPLINNRPLGSDSVEQIVTAVLADAETTGTAVLGREQLRESMRRLGLDGPTVGRVAPPLLVWLVKADVLGAAADEGAPWAAPRPLMSTDPGAVRLLLRAVEPPTPEEVEQERARGLK
jgi:hypothetical protein